MVYHYSKVEHYHIIVAHHHYIRFAHHHHIRFAHHLPGRVTYHHSKFAHHNIRITRHNIKVANHLHSRVKHHHNKVVGSMVEWLECRDCDRHGTGSKPTRAILLYSWKRHLTTVSPACWSGQAVLN